VICTVIGQLGAVLHLERTLILDDFCVGTEPPYPLPHTKFGITPEIASPGWIGRSSAAPEFHTGLYFWTRLEEELPENAIKRVERKLPALTAAMSLAVGENVQAVISVAHYEGGYVEPGSTSQFVLLEDASIAEDVASAVWAALKAAPSEVVAHLYRGRQLLATPSFSVTLQQDGAILEFVKVVEGLAQQFGSLETDPEALSAATEEVVNRCAATLVGNASLKKRASSIKTARDEIMRLDNSFLNLKVESTLSHFGLSGPWRIVSKNLMEARNKKLAHPGDNLSHQEREDLLSGTDEAPSAEALAEALLARSLGVAADDIASMRQYSGPLATRRRAPFPDPVLGAPIAVGPPGSTAQVVEATLSIGRRPLEGDSSSPA